MELSVKKVNNAITNFVEKEIYKTNPSRFMFDYISDPDYVYVAKDAHYIIRVPRVDMSQILSATHTAIRTDLNLERLIDTVVGDINATDFYMAGLGVIGSDNKEVVIFESHQNDRLYINPKFFEEFYKHPITKYGVPDNITFTGISGKNSYKSPLVMWEDDDAIALFLPINPSKNCEVHNAE